MAKNQTPRPTPRSTAQSRELQIGKVDPECGATVAWIAGQGKDYAVFLSDDDVIHYWYHRVEFCDGFNDTIRRASALEALPVADLQRAHCQDFRRLIAYAIAVALDEDEKTNSRAELLLDNAEAYFTARRTEQVRVWNVLSSALAAMIAALVALVIWWIRGRVAQEIGQPGLEIALASAAGCVGAFVSITLRLGTYSPNLEAAQPVHMLEAVARVLCGGVAAAALYLAIRAGVVLSSAMIDTHRIATILFLSLGAGASERLLPGLLARADNPTAADPNT